LQYYISCGLLYLPAGNLTMVSGFVAFGWMVFFINTCILISIRNEVRIKLIITGNLVEDFFVACSFMYPQGLLQTEKQLFELKEGHIDIGAKGTNETISAVRRDSDVVSA
jgi:hypothetical protein